MQCGAYPSGSESEMQIHDTEFNLLIQEEMRCVIVYHKWRADWWRECVSRQNHEDQAISSGISGYAHKQADICVRMAEQCGQHWLPHLKARGIVPSWGLNYKHLLVELQESLGHSEALGGTTQDLDDIEDLNEDDNVTEGEEEGEVDEMDYFELDDI